MIQSVLGAVAQSVNPLNKGIPGVPLHSLDAISDENTRQVLRSIVDGWHVRNGSSGTGDQRFVTASELGNIEGSISGIRRTLSAVQSEAKDAIKPGDISRIIYDLQVSIMESELFRQLGERIDLIDLNLVEEQQERIQQAQDLASQVQGVADDLTRTANDLAAEAATRLGFDNVQGSKIASLETTTSDQATQISGLTTRVGGAESTIINLQNTTATQARSLTTLTTRTAAAESNIVNLQLTSATQATQLSNLVTQTDSSESKITGLQQTTATQAQSLTTLTTRVGAAESSITALNTTTATQATQLNSLTTRTATAESNISTLETTTASQANSLTALTTRVANSEAAITSEQTTRANADNAITSNVNTQVSRIDTNVSAIQTQTNTLSNNFASLSNQITTIQSAIGANSVAIQQESQTRATKDGLLEAQYTVKIDNNGYVSGFGLASTSSNSTPFSEFIVRADRFSIGSPGANPSIPFIVTGGAVYIDKAFIADAAVDTLRIAGEAVTTTDFAEQLTGINLTGTPQVAVQKTITISQLGSAEACRILVIAVVQAYPSNSVVTNLLTGIYVGETMNTTIGSTYASSGISVANVGSFLAPNGTYTISCRVSCTANPNGASSKAGNNFLARLIIMGAKR